MALMLMIAKPSFLFVTATDVMSPLTMQSSAGDETDGEYAVQTKHG
jgi:hypothetical protein